MSDIVASSLNLGATTISSEAQGSSSLWSFVQEHLSNHERDRFLILKNVKSDEGRSRAWLRALLNEHSLERYIHVSTGGKKLSPIKNAFCSLD